LIDIVFSVLWFVISFILYYIIECYFDTWSGKYGFMLLLAIIVVLFIEFIINMALQIMFNIRNISIKIKSYVFYLVTVSDIYFLFIIFDRYDERVNVIFFSFILLKFLIVKYYYTILKRQIKN
jgi:hypothetical protein